VQVIVNGGALADADTPEHNRMQALFLDPAMCAAAYRAIVGGVMDDGQAVHIAESVQFEVGGWDVVLRRALGETRPSIAIELKPSLGDDYPAVLRKMRARAGAARAEHIIAGRGGHYDPRAALRGDHFYAVHVALIVDHFAADGASWDQVVRIFEASGFVVRKLAEVRATMEKESKSPTVK
jgi:hypothetical protein